MLVVGAGPSGLSAAYHLTRLGHSVTVKDARPSARTSGSAPASRPATRHCYGACPDAAILKNTGVIKTGPGDYEVDYDYCKGCGICAAECPCGVIAMVPEEP